MPRRRPLRDVQAVIRLKSDGLTDREVCLATGVPITTIRAWRSHGLPSGAKRALEFGICPRCGCDPHDFSGLPAATYAYLLALYLGDGYLSRSGKSSWALHIALDAAYPGIIQSCCDAIEHIRAGHRPNPRADSREPRCVRIHTTWRQWTCLLPQHGAGRKHSRRIELTAWQRAIVDQAPQAFLRGLIHTDGWRGVNRVHVKGKDYQYPRYQFSNRSDDIRKLFTDVCDQLGVEWRQWTRYHISVAKRDSVALLDTFIGPKT